MCKLLIIPGCHSKAIDAAWSFTMGAVGIMTKSDNDGYGYASYSPRGIWGEKWLYPKDAFRKRETNEKIQKYSDDLGIAVDIPTTYKSFGQLSSEDSTSVLVHSRMATCGKSIENTHPFYDAKEQLALIHNGVISNHSEHDKKLSSCDSEAILSSYIENKIKTSPENIQKLVDSLEGSFACGVLGHDGSRPYVDIFKNQYSNLYVSRIDALGCYVFATTGEIIAAGCKKIKARMGPLLPIASNSFLRLDAITGEKLFDKAFTHEPKTYGYSGSLLNRGYGTGKDYTDWEDWATKKDTEGRLKVGI